MRVVIVTGMSGAGKSTALNLLEDIGYFCVDNLPIQLIPKLADLFGMMGEIEKIALGLDIRSGQNLNELEAKIQTLQETNITLEILFLEAKEEILVKRYKETRRKHPLAMNGSMKEGIRKERETIAFLKSQADYIIDTSRLLTRELTGKLRDIFVERKAYRNLYVTIMSFGFKYGAPEEADLTFDVRFLPNPYYKEEMRKKTGKEEDVRMFVMENETAKIFLEKLNDMLYFLLPNYIAEGKHQLVIAIGCTGGKHRSVAVADEVYKTLSKGSECGVNIVHRDITKERV